MSVTLAYPNLFSPLQVGSLELRNRIVACTHGTGLSLDPSEPEPGRRYASYLARRARGGAGLVMLGASYAFVQGSHHGGRLSFSVGNALYQWPAGEVGTEAQERFTAYLGLIADAVHDEGGAIFAQLSLLPSRSGAYGYATTYAVDYMHLTSSQGATMMGGIAARVLRAAEIPAMVAAAGQLAAAVRDAGIDGVELHAHAGDLIADFLSPAHNRRADEYGGPLENRMRLPVETLRSIRAAVGDDYVVGLRFSPWEEFDGGLTLDEGIEVLQRIEAMGLIDEVNVFGPGPNVSPAGTADMSYPEALFTEPAARIRAALAHGTPVLCGGRINFPETGERLIAEGKADLIGMTRALIADPDLPRKAQAGEGHRIRPCTYSSEGCIALLNATRVPTIQCVVNPETGWETDEPPAPPERLKRIAVVGAGPAGLKVAEQAAERGHAVVLFEREPFVGGQVELQSRVPSRRTERVATDFLARMPELGVEVRLGRAPTPDELATGGFDAVVLATGSRGIRTEYTNLVPGLPGLPGADLPFVLTSERVLAGAPVGERVVIVEDSSGGDLRAPLVAEHLLAGGHRVRAVTSDTTIGSAVLFRTYRPLFERLYAAGFEMLPHTAVTAITPERTLVTANAYTGAPGLVEGLDSVVLVLGQIVDDTLRRQLEGRVPELYEVGDAVLPRSVGAAILEGFKLGRTL